MRRIIVLLILSSLMLSGCSVHEDKTSSSGSKVTESEKNQKVSQSVSASFKNGSNTSSFNADKEHISETDNQLNKEQEFKPDSDKSSNLWDFTIQDIYNANKNDSVFEQYDNVQTSVSAEDASVFMYADKDFTYTSEDGFCDGTIGDRTCSYEDGKYFTEFSLDKETINMYEYSILLDDTFLCNVISDVKEDGNDLIITAQMDESDTEDLLYMLDMDENEGGIAVSTFRVHADDLIIEENTIEIVNGNDSETLITFSNKFNCGLPSEAQNIYDHMNLPDKRTISLIVNPGSASEYTLSTTGIKGDELQFVSRDHSHISQYEDRECTKDYTTATDADTSADFVIYGKEFW